VLKPVFNQIFEIERIKSDRSYDGKCNFNLIGNLRAVQPQGEFEIDGVTCIERDVSAKENTVLCGDSSGGVHLLDCQKKITLHKQIVSPGCRIQHISSKTISLEGINLITFAVIRRTFGEVQIFRYL